MFPYLAQYIPAKRNGGFLLQDRNNFLYNLSKKKENNVFYVCQQKGHQGCKVTATVKPGGDGGQDMVTAVHGEHNHDTDLTKVMVGNVVKEEVATASKNLNVSPRAVMANITSKLQNANQSQAVYVLPKMSTISKQVQRAREREFQMPQVPRSWDELKVPEAMSVTCSDEPFLIMEE